MTRVSGFPHSFRLSESDLTLFHGKICVFTVLRQLVHLVNMDITNLQCCTENREFFPLNKLPLNTGTLKYVLFNLEAFHIVAVITVCNITAMYRNPMHFA